MILDSTSGMKQWPQFADIRIDIAKELKPDILASACYLPFRDAVFSSIYCHPPYLIGRQRHAKFLGRFAYWLNRENWSEFLKETDAEFSRCLKAEGRLHYRVESGHFWGMTHYNGFKRQMPSFITEIEERIPTNRPRGNKLIHLLTMRLV